MGAESNNFRDALVDQLASFESELGEKAGDVAMLSRIQEGIGSLLADGRNTEAEIRRVLQERYDGGELRQETFQLVKSMLDRYVSEQAPTSPGTPDAQGRIEPSFSAAEPDIETTPVELPQPDADDAMSSTMVLPADVADGIRSPDERVQVGSVLRDRFMLQEQVSGGSMGVVYKALDRRLAEAGTEAHHVAIKVLSPKLSQSGLALRALQQEATKGRCLVHPNIVRFIDLDRDDDLYFIVMEWLEGRTLADILDSPDSRHIDVERAFEIVRQVGKALDYAHRCGIVHADVKPGNIMIMPNGDAKLFDFGVARIRQKQLDDDPKFDPGVLGLLTPAYSSMQVLTGEKPVPSDDVFSLACLLYRLVAGYRVFGPRNAAEAAQEGMKPQRLDQLSDASWRVLKKALAYSRVARFETMTDFIEALDVEAATSITVDMPAPARFTEDTEERRVSSRVVLALVVLLVLAGVGADQMGMLDALKDRYRAGSEAGIPEEVLPLPELSETTPAVIDAPAQDEEAAAESVAEEPQAEAAAGELDDDALKPAEQVSVPEPEVSLEPLVDFSTLPPATAELRIREANGEPESVTVRLREDSDPATVDFVRENVDLALTLRLEEVGFSGSRSPWSAAQFELSDNGYVEFPIGQDRARVTLTMTPDVIREADQQSTLRLRETDMATSRLGTINVILEDDDQRVFESTLPANTVAFAASQVTVNEQDPAVQLDILRYNPDNAPMIVGFRLRDITATQGEDYFAPGGFTVEFGPGQRATRLLIPLVQDSEYEDNEAFSVELSVADSAADIGVHHRVAVLIRDDDQ
jgi:serine/threonine protein kinase